MNNPNELLLLSLKDFYSNESNIHKLLSIVSGTSKISLRLIDWFITNHCKSHRDIVIQSKEKHIFNIYQNYRSQLKAYKKIKFDPFRRRQRIVFFYSDEQYLNTTVGQLNFFKWAIYNNILEFITENVDNLEECMNTFQKNAKNDKTFKRNIENANTHETKDEMTTSEEDHHRIKIKSSTSVVCFD
jgi:hypothetical protein